MKKFNLKKIILVVLVSILSLSLSGVVYAKTNPKPEANESKEEKVKKVKDKTKEEKNSDCEKPGNGVGNAYGVCKEKNNKNTKNSDSNEEWENKDDYEKTKDVVNEATNLINTIKN